MAPIVLWLVHYADFLAIFDGIFEDVKLVLFFWGHLQASVKVVVVVTTLATLSLVQNLESTLAVKVVAAVHENTNLFEVAL